MKRDVSAADVAYSSSMSSAGSKRSVRDRIGNNADSSMWHGNGLGGNKRCVCACGFYSIFSYYGIGYRRWCIIYLNIFPHTHPRVFTFCLESSPWIMF